jgi:DNA (cytosine-5)-methyltransferase 1
MDYWLRIGEAARLLDLSVDTLRRWDWEGRFRAHRTTGGHRRYRLDEVQRLVRRRARRNRRRRAKPFDLTPAG